MPHATPARPSFDTRLTLHVLGGASLVCPAPGPEPETSFGPGKPLALLVYLALAPERSATREHLLDLLWSDVDPDKGRAALRQTLYEIKRRLGEGVLTTARDSIRLAATVESDRTHFLEAVAGGALEQATSLYAGDFLPSFALPGGAEFEKWADAERFQLRSTFVRAAESLVRTWLASTRLRDAQDLARRVRDADPLSESGWRLVLETLVAAGDTLRANVEADRLEQMLTEEGREADPPTRAVLRLVRQGPDDARHDSTTPQDLFSDLVGREREFAALIQQWEAARRGGSRHVHLSAPAGIGKTRLLSDLQARLRVLRARVILVRAHPGERRIPYALAADVACALADIPGAGGVSPAAAATLVDLCPSMSSRLKAQPRTPAPGEAMRHRLAAVEDLIAVIAEERPVAILIDDLHWADAASHELLEGVVGRLPTAPVLIVTAGRPVPQGSLEMPATLRLELAPLTVSQLAALIGTVGSLPDTSWAGRLAQALHAATGGSPLLARETLHLALDRGLLTLGENGWTCDDPTSLWELLAAGSALTRRIESLSSGAASHLRLLSIAGTPLELCVLAASAHDSLEASEQALTELEQRGLVQRDSEWWRPAHDEIAERCADAAGADLRRSAHAALGRALSSGTEDLQKLRLATVHLAAAEDPALGPVFARSVALLRSRGDRRSLSHIATELLGEGQSADGVRRLLSTLPLHLRLRLDSAARVAAMATLTLVGIGGAVAWSRWPVPPPPDAVVVGIPADFEAPLVSARLHFADWRRGESVIELVRVRNVRGANRLREPSIYLPVARPGGGWAHVRVYPPDSGGNEIVLTSPNGQERRLTNAPRDDEMPSFSPDGRYMVYQTARWNIYFRYDLVVHDLVADSSWALTRSRDSLDFEAPSHLFPHWSPDGTRIAFARLRWDNRPDDICWIPMDGAVGPRCLSTTALELDGRDPTITGPALSVLLGWYDSEWVVVTLDESKVLARVKLSTGEIRIIDGAMDARASSLSPDGRFLLLLAQQTGYPGGATYVAPVDDPDSRKRLTLTGSDSGFKAVFGRPEISGRYLESVAIQERAEAIPRDGRHRLSTIGFDARGRRTPVRILRWSSRDASVALIDSLTGMLHPRRQGSVTIHVSAGGWRSDSAVIRIGDAHYAAAPIEQWDPGTRPVQFDGSQVDSSRWRAFGSPLPEIVQAPDGQWAFSLNGDGNYSSGAYTTERFTATRGLGLEAAVSTRVDRAQWQALILELNASLDEAYLRSWDHQMGAYRLLTDSPRVCSSIYPHAERQQLPGKIRFDAAGASHEVAVKSNLMSGEWYRVRIQIFPDGTCGFALDGEPVWRTTRPMLLDRPFRIVVSGNAAFTPMLVGPVNVWSGVRPDTDWTVLDDTTTLGTPAAAGLRW